MADKYDLSVILRVLDKASAPLTRIGGKFRQLTKPIDEVNRRTQALGRSLQKIGKSMGQVGRNMSLKLTLPLTLMAGIATKASIDFESAFTGVRKTVEATEPQFEALKKGLMGLARKIPLGTQEIFGIAEAAGQLGIKQGDMMKFTKVMADLGATTNMTAEEAATELARFANVVGVSSKDFDRLGSVIVDLGNNMAANEREIVEMGGRLKTAGKLSGMSAAQIMGLSAALTSIGINAEAGGTAFSQVMMRISKELGTGSEKMQGFAKISGMSVAEFEKSWKDNAAETLLKFTEGLGKLDKKGKNVSEILDFLGMDGIRVSMSLLGAAQSGDTFRKALARSEKAWRENIALTKEANLRYKTTASRLKIAMNWVMQMAAAFGDILKRALIAVIDRLMPVIKWLTKLGPTGKTIIIIIGALVAAIGPLLIIFGQIAFAIGAIMAIATPALIALLAPIAAVVVAVAAIGFAIIQVIRHWNEFPEIVRDILGFVWDIFSRTVGAIVDLIKSIGIGLFTGNWDPLITYFRDLWKTIETIFTDAYLFVEDIVKKIMGVIPDWVKKRLGIEVETKKTETGTPELSNVERSREEMRRNLERQGVGGAVGAIAGNQKSQTDINLKVSAEPGTTATIEKVKKKKGDANVSTDLLGFVGEFQ